MSFSPDRVTYLAAKIVRTLTQAREMELLREEKLVLEQVLNTLSDQFEKQERMNPRGRK